MKQYTNIRKKGNILYIKGYDNGESYQEEIMYQPYLFIPSQEETGYKSVYGDNVKKIEFSSMGAAYDYVKKYENSNKIYGLQNYEYVYLYDNFKENFEYDYNLLKIIEFDIETSRTKYDEHKKVKIRKK